MNANKNASSIIEALRKSRGASSAVAHDVACINCRFGSDVSVLDEIRFCECLRKMKNATLIRSCTHYEPK